MSDKSSPGLELPFHVRTHSGNCFMKGFKKEDEAKTDAAARSTKAQGMGLDARYKVSQKA